MLFADSSMEDVTTNSDPTDLAVTVHGLCSPHSIGDTSSNSDKIVQKHALETAYSIIDLAEHAETINSALLCGNGRQGKV